MSTPDRPAVVISLDAIYHLLQEVRDDVRDMKSDLEELSDDSRDHEKRIRTLESRVWQASGAAAVLASFAGFMLSRVIGV